MILARHSQPDSQYLRVAALASIEMCDILFEHPQVVARTARVRARDEAKAVTEAATVNRVNHVWACHVS